MAPDVTLSFNIVPILNDFRIEGIKGVVITSNHRSAKKNKAVGGKDNSHHLCGMALDIRTRDLDSKTRIKIIGLKRLGYDVVDEDNHLHIEKSSNKCELTLDK